MRTLVPSPRCCPARTSSPAGVSSGGSGRPRSEAQCLMLRAPAQSQRAALTRSCFLTPVWTNGGLARGAGGRPEPRAATACWNTPRRRGLAKKTREKPRKRCRKTRDRGRQSPKSEAAEKAVRRAAGGAVRQLADRGGAPAPAASAVGWSPERFRAERAPGHGKSAYPLLPLA